jgi:hypothetical protein
LNEELPGLLVRRSPGNHLIPLTESGHCLFALLGTPLLSELLV